MEEDTIFDNHCPDVHTHLRPLYRVRPCLSSPDETTLFGHVGGREEEENEGMASRQEAERESFEKAAEEGR